ncbi:MAG: helix-turn-helix transcriptional regulator [Desulfobacteraceae bacterium]|nr:helix-turn-helix transcriptional regulator [Desulfobacteraceae bacterium]
MSRKEVKGVYTRVRELRVEENWTLQELAHRADLSTSVIQKLEAAERAGKKSDPLTSTLEKLAGAFEVSVWEMFG